MRWVYDMISVMLHEQFPGAGTEVHARSRHGSKGNGVWLSVPQSVRNEHVEDSLGIHRGTLTIRRSFGNDPLREVPIAHSLLGSDGQQDTAAARCGLLATYLRRGGLEARVRSESMVTHLNHSASDPHAELREEGYRIELGNEPFAEAKLKNLIGTRYDLQRVQHANGRQSFFVSDYTLRKGMAERNRPTIASPNVENAPVAPRKIPYHLQSDNPARVVF